MTNYEEIPLFAPLALPLGEAARVCGMAPASLRAATWRLTQAGRELRVPGTFRPQLWDSAAVAAWIAEGKPMPAPAPPRVAPEPPAAAQQLWDSALEHAEQARRSRSRAAQAKVQAIRLCREQGMSDAAIGAAFDVPRQRVSQLAGSRSRGQR